MVTAQAHPVDRFKGIRMFKVDDYVVKPFSTNVLLQKIQDIIKEREL
jgi:DNA-binding response OmpR family regulator